MHKRGLLLRECVLRLRQPREVCRGGRNTVSLRQWRGLFGGGGSGGRRKRIVRSPRRNDAVCASSPNTVAACVKGRGNAGRGEV
jgi:hypothetical protein